MFSFPCPQSQTKSCQYHVWKCMLWVTYIKRREETYPCLQPPRRSQKTIGFSVMLLFHHLRENRNTRVRCSWDCEQTNLFVEKTSSTSPVKQTSTVHGTARHGTALLELGEYVKVTCRIKATTRINNKKTYGSNYCLLIILNLLFYDNVSYLALSIFDLKSQCCARLK